jgi:hypothetical protein
MNYGRAAFSCFYHKRFILFPVIHNVLGSVNIRIRVAPTRFRRKAVSLRRYAPRNGENGRYGKEKWLQGYINN